MKRNISHQYVKTCSECGDVIPAGTYYNSEQEGLTEYVQCDVCAAAESEEGDKLPPDPDGQNEDRAKWAGVALDAFIVETGTDREDALADLLCDLMHWANVYGQDFDRGLSRATDSYAEEIAPESSTQPLPGMQVEK